jgi:hypothetical protein
MWVIRYAKEDRLHTVGHYDPNGGWVALADFDTPDDAARYVHWLNGGDSGEAFQSDAELRRMVSRRGKQ